MAIAALIISNNCRTLFRPQICLHYQARLPNPITGAFRAGLQPLKTSHSIRVLYYSAYLLRHLLKELLVRPLELLISDTRACSASIRRYLLGVENIFAWAIFVQDNATGEDVCAVGRKRIDLLCAVWFRPDYYRADRIYVGHHAGIVSSLCGRAG